jgi:hypothetical protein
MMGLIAFVALRFAWPPLIVLSIAAMVIPVGVASPRGDG